MDETKLNEKIISQHIFMFPFRLKKDYTLGDLKENLVKEGWKYKPFELKWGDASVATKYNEWVYFHEYVRSALFEDSKGEDNISIYLERDIPEKARIVLHIKDGMVYTLPIKRISLRLFETNVGILTIEVLNYDYRDVKDVLIINDFGRRIYPQFIGEQGGTEDTKNEFLADKIEFYFGRELIIENFKCEDFLKKELKVASYIEYLLGKTFKDEVIPVIDDRMFTLCWYGNEEFSKQLRLKKCSEYEFESSDDWYKFIYIDGKNIGVANKEMQKQLIQNATYSRWADYGTLFGISRYSLVCLTDESNFGYNLLRKHMETIYYQMAIILLAQRASILKFSKDVSSISSRIKRNPRGFIDRDTFDKVKELYSLFIRFENMLHFTEVTPQEQGIEMYNLAYKNMALEDLISKLKYEIEKLHEFVDLQHSRESNEGISRLQRISLLLPLPIVATLVNFVDFLFPAIKVKVLSFDVLTRLVVFGIFSVIIFVISYIIYTGFPVYFTKPFTRKRRGKKWK